jgi:hypothetical protein
VNAILSLSPTQNLHGSWSLNSLSQKLTKRNHMAMTSVQNLVEGRKYPLIFTLAIFLFSATILCLYSNNFQSHGRRRRSWNLNRGLQFYFWDKWIKERIYWMEDEWSNSGLFSSHQVAFLWSCFVLSRWRKGGGFMSGIGKEEMVIMVH